MDTSSLEQIFLQIDWPSVISVLALVISILGYINEKRDSALHKEENIRKLRIYLEIFTWSYKSQIKAVNIGKRPIVLISGTIRVIPSGSERDIEAIRGYPLSPSEKEFPIILNDGEEIKFNLPDTEPYFAPIHSGETNIIIYDSAGNSYNNFSIREIDEKNNYINEYIYKEKRKGIFQKFFKE